MLVRRGRKEITTICTKGFGRGWWAITVAHVIAALEAFTRLTRVTLGSTVWEMRGIPIGGVFSAVCVVL
eukprot:13292246-Heterocapsa_arctica.AAC.1